MIRLSFTLVAAFLLALAATFWWTGERTGVPAPEEVPATAVALEAPPTQTPPSAPARTPEKPVSQTVETPPLPAVTPAAVVEHVALTDPGDFMPDPGPVGEASRLPDVASRPEITSESAPAPVAEGPVVYVDPERSAGFVERLLRIYEVVRE